MGGISGGYSPTTSPSISPSMSSLHMFTKPIPEIPKFKPQSPLSTNIGQTPLSSGIPNTSFSSMPTEIQQKIGQEVQTTNQSNQQAPVEAKTP